MLLTYKRTYYFLYIAEWMNNIYLVGLLKEAGLSFPLPPLPPSQ